MIWLVSVSHKFITLKMVLNSEILMTSDGQRVPFPGRFWSHFKTLSCVVVEPAVVIPPMQETAAGLRPFGGVGWFSDGDL